VNDGFPAAADELQRVISCVRLYFGSGRDDFCGQAVKLGNIFYAQVIVSAYLDHLPFGRSNRNRGSKGQASEDKRENRTTLYWEGHACAYGIKNGIDLKESRLPSRQSSELPRLR
jgi:hypothetical protein